MMLGTSVQISVQWHEGKVRVRASVVLPAAAATEDALPSMLRSLFQSFAAMQVLTPQSCAFMQVPIQTGFFAPVMLLCLQLRALC